MVFVRQRKNQLGRALKKFMIAATMEERTEPLLRRLGIDFIRLHTAREGAFPAKNRPNFECASVPLYEIDELEYIR